LSCAARAWRRRAAPRDRVERGRCFVALLHRSLHFVGWSISDLRAVNTVHRISCLVLLDQLRQGVEVCLRFLEIRPSGVET
jgi:hypothetical protein